MLGAYSSLLTRQMCTFNHATVSDLRYQVMFLDICTPILSSDTQRMNRLGEDLDATSVAYHLGYNDTSHFNRDYKNLFGKPPNRDIQLRMEYNTASVVS